MKRICIFCDKKFKGKLPKYGICPECKEKIIKEVKKK